MFKIYPEKNISYLRNCLSDNDECYALDYYYPTYYKDRNLLSVAINYFKNKDYEHRAKLIEIFAKLLIKNIGECNATLIPIATSKQHGTVYYDNRLVLLCEKTVSLFNNRIIKTNNATYNHFDIFQAKENIKKTSSQYLNINQKLSILENNIIISDSINWISQLTTNIILIDDVFTTGAHFKVCKQKLTNIINNNRINTNIYGLFLAKTHHRTNIAYITNEKANMINPNIF